MPRKVSKSQPKLPESAPPPPLGSTLPNWAAPVAIFAAYLAALIYARNSVPDGINNDVAEEALRGLYLVLGHHFEVVTFAVGNSAETLYLYLVGAAAALVGTGTLAIQLVSWAFGMACIWL